MTVQSVGDLMTRNPVTITSDTTLPETRRLMQERAIRHLPVVDNGRLVGIVTWGDVREASASDATSLSVFELNYLLEKLPVSQIMTRDPITIEPGATIAHAVQIMVEHKIGSLPVMKHGKLVGIITESDIMRMLATGKAA